MQIKVDTLKISLTSLFLITQHWFSYGQIAEFEDKLPPSFNGEATHGYFSGSLTTGLVTYRDFATSPLFYSGPGIVISTSNYERSAQKEQTFDLRFGLFTAFDQAPESNVLNSSSFATLTSLYFYYHYLFGFQGISNNKWNFKAGPSAIITQNFRFNPSLFNNALGLENISNLMISGLVTRDFTRKKERRLNFYLFSVNLPERRRELRFAVNVGLLNFNYRPGYAYAYDAEIVGTETNPIEWALANYRWTMNGWRLQTRLEWVWYLYNGNAYSIYYDWDALHAPGRFEVFQMATHNIGFAYFFEFKIRRLK